ncbi:hypothetical protein BC936DRAFT_138856 [Jimgerdemannia flammicorona]|uniref:Uncharacterized protein n=1 Tax=Jimgerdemannia flammicorona TaxID=994334 RepID=A0A433BFY1_9FUNG|nr:hypothetical protein BC936DRAFT_138856 [Jimgerdemannia flammicorona]
MSSEKPKELSMDEEYERYKLIEYESGWNRLMRKAKEEPFVSAGEPAVPLRRAPSSFAHSPSSFFIVLRRHRAHVLCPRCRHYRIPYGGPRLRK